MNLLPSLKPKIERPFTDKLMETQGLIARNIHLFGDKCTVAFSGGKDSEVVLWLTLQVKPDVLVVFNDTERGRRMAIKEALREYPESDLLIFLVKGEDFFSKAVPIFDVVKEKGLAKGVAYEEDILSFVRDKKKGRQ